MAITSLTKGLLGFALPLLVIGVYSCLRDGWRRSLRTICFTAPSPERLRRLIERNRWFFNWYSIAAVAMAALRVLPALRHLARLMGSTKGLDMVYRENVVRFFEPFDHRGPIYLYVYVIFGLMAPWSMLLARGAGPGARAAPSRRRAGAAIASR